MSTIIKLENVTKDYGQNRGVFNLNLEIEEGEVFGLVGINGSGKTTTLRQMMGFIKPSNGKITIDGKDAWKNASHLKKEIGYVPGEIAFPDTRTGVTFLKTQSEMIGIDNNSITNELIQALKLDTDAIIKRMSKGMKQKTAIVDAFMPDTKILLLDEPTTGLDPVMRDVFIEMILECKKRKKTIIMSSHMFNELEPTCDRIAFLKNGKIVNIIDTIDMAKIRAVNKVTIAFDTPEEFDHFRNQKVSIISDDKTKKTITVLIEEEELNHLFELLSQYDIKDIIFDHQGLDDYFENHINLEA